MAEITYHGERFLEIEHGTARIFVDPVFGDTRRGRRTRGATRACDYVLVSNERGSFDDALDVLEDHPDSTLVGSMAACREARRELRIARDRTVDLEAFERAGDGDVRITAIPLVAPTPASSGLAFMEGIGESFEAELTRAFSRSPLGNIPLGGLRSLARLPNASALGAFGGPTVGEPSLGFLLELGGTAVALLGQGIHDGTDEVELEDLASLGAIDTLVCEAVGSIGAVVRAVRILEPRHVCLYRSHDPYGRGRRALALRGADVPVSSYVEAITEDQGRDVEARVLRPGDRTTVRVGQPAAATEVRPS